MERIICFVCELGSFRSGEMRQMFSNYLHEKKISGFRLRNTSEHDIEVLRSLGENDIIVTSHSMTNSSKEQIHATARHPENIICAPEIANSESFVATGPHNRISLGDLILKKIKIIDIGKKAQLHTKSLRKKKAKHNRTLRQKRRL